MPKLHGILLVLLATAELAGTFGVFEWYGHRNASVFFGPAEDRKLEAIVVGTHLSDPPKRFYTNIVSYGEEVGSVESSTSLDLPGWGQKRTSMPREENTRVHDARTLRDRARPQNKPWLI